MASRRPVTRQIAWVPYLLQVSVMVVLAIVFLTVFDPFTYIHFVAFTFSVAAYLGLMMVLRFCVPRNHRRGMVLYKNGKPEEAIDEFKKSYEFFTKNQWLDKYRYVVLLSASRVSYKEMDLNNIACCYSLVGDGAASKHYFEKTLEQFPDSELAKQALLMIKTFEKKPEE